MSARRITFTAIESGALACLLDGMTARAAAEAMGRSFYSVRRALERVRGKLDAANLTDAAIAAWWLP